MRGSRSLWTSPAVERAPLYQASGLGPLAAIVVRNRAHMRTLLRQLPAIVVEGFILFVFLTALWHRVRRRWFPGPGVPHSIQRGEKSWNRFVIAFFVAFGLASVVVSTAEISGTLMGVLHIANGVVVFYLCFFDSWFRNKIIGFFGRSANMKERF